MGMIALVTTTVGVPLAKLLLKHYLGETGAGVRQPGRGHASFHAPAERAWTRYPPKPPPTTLPPW